MTDSERVCRLCAEPVRGPRNWTICEACRVKRTYAPLGYIKAVERTCDDEWKRRIMAKIRGTR